jgi:hypothetical protein
MSNGGVDYLASHCSHESGHSDTDNQGADFHDYLHQVGRRAYKDLERSISWPYLRRNIHACRSRDPNKLLFCEEADFAFLRFTSVSVVLNAAEHTLSHEIMFVSVMAITDRRMMNAAYRSRTRTKGRKSCVATGGSRCGS